MQIERIKPDCEGCLKLIGDIERVTIKYLDLAHEVKELRQQVDEVEMDIDADELDAKRHSEVMAKLDAIHRHTGDCG